MKSTLASLVASLLASAVLGQIVVDPNGGGHFRDLQAAIAAAPPNTVIKVIGGTYGPLTIDRSLTIAGAPAPTIRSPAAGSGLAQPPAITLSGNGRDRLVLQNVRVTGTVNGFVHSEAGRGISGSGFAALHVYDSVVQAHEWVLLTGLGRGQPAIELSGAATILIDHSSVQGSTTDTDSSGMGWLPPGAPGIRAPNATVIALLSTIRGGACGRSNFDLAPPEPAPCPCNTAGGVGGPGVVSAALIDVASVVAGGAGSEVFFRPTFMGPYLPWGRQPDGEPFVVGRRTLIALDLFAATAPRLGTTWQIDALFPVGLPAVMILGSLAPLPLPFGGGLLFVDVAQPFAALPTSQRTIAIPIPNDQTLGGGEACLQLLSPTTGLTSPVPFAIAF
ncbi:MAG: hypothetical protein R3F56_09485 [Planctomycetota bacterium]